MTFTYAVSFESDIHPVETIRGTVDGEDAAEAVRRAVYRAEIARTGKTRFRSLLPSPLRRLLEPPRKSPTKPRFPTRLLRLPGILVQNLTHVIEQLRRLVREWLDRRYAEPVDLMVWIERVLLK